MCRTPLVVALPVKMPPGWPAVAQITIYGPHEPWGTRSVVNGGPAVPMTKLSIMKGMAPSRSSPSPIGHNQIEIIPALLLKPTGTSRRLT
jgi:hypothetical protein